MGCNWSFYQPIIHGLPIVHPRTNTGCELLVILLQTNNNSCVKSLVVNKLPNYKAVCVSMTIHWLTQRMKERGIYRSTNLSHLIAKSVNLYSVQSANLEKFAGKSVFQREFYTKLGDPCALSPQTNNLRWLWEISGYSQPSLLAWRRISSEWTYNDTKFWGLSFHLVLTVAYLWKLFLSFRLTKESGKNASSTLIPYPMLCLLSSSLQLEKDGRRKFFCKRR